MFERMRIRKLLGGLDSADAATREAALRAVKAKVTKGLSDDEAGILLAEIARPWPYPIGEKPVDAAVLGCFVRGMYPGAVGAALTAFPQLSNEGKSELIELLGCHHDPKCTAGVISIVQKHAATGLLPKLPSSAMNASNPARASVIFPGILVALRSKHLRMTAMRHALAALSKGAVSAQVFRDHVQDIAAILTENLPLAKQYQQPNVKRWDANVQYHAVRHESGIALDLATYLADPKLLSAASDWLELTDPYLLTYAQLAILSLGGKPDTRALYQAAASAEYRNVLYEGLGRLGRASVFPTDYHKVGYFAESRLVEWLSSGFELGEAPDTIEVAGAVRHEESGKAVLSILFRFTHERTHPGKILTGAVFGCDPSDIVLRDSGSAFSSFRAWEEADMIGHLRIMFDESQEFKGATQLDVDQLRREQLL